MEKKDEEVRLEMLELQMIEEKLKRNNGSFCKNRKRMVVLPVFR